MSDPEPSTPEGAPAVVSADALSGQTLRFYDFVMAAFVAILLLSNVLGAGKVAVVKLPIVGEWPFGAGILFFPVSYVIGDVLTEVYGYARARRVIWAGFAATVFMAFMAWVVVALPPAPDWANQAAYETVFGQVPRIVAASMCAFWAGEFVNSYVLARMKVWSGGAAPVDADDRLDNRRAGCRQPDLLPARFPRRGGMDDAAGRHGVVHAMGAEGRVGSAAYARHLRGGWWIEARREYRRVRRGHGLLAIPCSRIA